MTPHCKLPRYTYSVDKGPLRASVSLDIKHLLTHVNEFLGLRCAADYLGERLLPMASSLKELTETMAAFAAVRRHVGEERFGDGSAPPR